MYDRDMPIMRDHALASPQGLLDVITFVLCTIQQPISQVHRQMRDIREHGEHSKYLFGTKRLGYCFARDNIDWLYDALLVYSVEGQTAPMINAFMAVPGLGITKASFVAQICGFEVACLDMHNLQVLGMNPASFKTPKSLKPETVLEKIKTYIEICETTGGSRYWWDHWCHYVAARGHMNKNLPTGDAVSAFHVTALLAA